RSLLSFVFSWRRLLKFHTAVFDMAAAGQVVERAQRWRLPGSASAAGEFRRQIEALRPIRPAVEAARADLEAVMAGKPREFRRGAVAIFIPESALVHSPENPVFADIRKILAETLQALDEMQAPYTLHARLHNHGTPLVPEDVSYISHHTMSGKTNGLHFKVTDRPHCFSFDRRGYSGWAEFADMTAEALAHVDQAEADLVFEQDRARVIGGNVSKYAQPDAAAASPGGEPWIFVALQTANDAVQKLARMPMLDMLAEVAEEGRRRGIRVIVKRHPRCFNKKVGVALRAGTDAGLFELSTASIHALITGSCAVCTVNSSVGAEALLHLKPVYLFGRSEYQSACYQIHAPGDFSRLFAPDRLPLPPEDIRRFQFLLRKTFAHDIEQATFPFFLRHRLSYAIEAARALP
ncbi:MAG TPA: hypothetical protein VFY63_14130, partial [Pseudorhizobium sp.]|nr:hypothetical protein [Pseudorhizobium sp.]